MIITNTSSTTTTTASTLPEEISTISTKLIIRQRLSASRRLSAMLPGTFSWTDLAIVIHEDDADCSMSPSPIVIHEDDADCSMSPSPIVIHEDDADCSMLPSPPYNKRRHVDIINSTNNGNNEIRRRRPKYQSQTVIHRPTIQPEVANFPWTDLAIINEE